MGSRPPGPGRAAPAVSPPFPVELHWKRGSSRARQGVGQVGQDHEPEVDVRGERPPEHGKRKTVKTPIGSHGPPKAGDLSCHASSRLHLLSRGRRARVQGRTSHPYRQGRRRAASRCRRRWPRTATSDVVAPARQVTPHPDSSYTAGSVSPVTTSVPRGWGRTAHPASAVGYEGARDPKREVLGQRRLLTSIRGRPEY